MNVNNTPDLRGFVTPSMVINSPFVVEENVILGLLLRSIWKVNYLFFLLQEVLLKLENL
ncbi:hypothetical protein PRIO_5094 [Paenibacillus riograndensis SBR5]|uniref:Uncharacterized protein n=1 Tax=Paenibacillus riograndensis SBR5 TaxID=1073571 RepID=A0A0E4CYJ3_9BACL|nr:hypothetical protein PRIO_5094 [Paenibacillus riograndensis SBR5]